MINFQYFPEKRNKSHDYVRVDRIKVVRGMNAFDEKRFEILESNSEFQAWINDGVIVVSEKEKSTTTRKRSEKSTNSEQTTLLEK